MKKILWLGLNPSSKNINPNVPFVGTRSNKRLSSWQNKLLEEFKGIEHITLNISNKVTAKSENIRTEDYLDIYSILATVKPDIIIGLGQKVGNRLKALNVAHFQVPHPSPRNRWYNKQSNETLTFKALKEVVRREIDE